MSIHRAFVFSMIGTVTLVAGCAPVILITDPDRNRPYDPFDGKVAVNYTANFKPTEPWHVDIDGSNLTSLTPAAMPGGNSSQGVSVAPGSHTVTAQGTCGTFCAYQSDQVVFEPPALRYNSITYVNNPLNLTNHVPTTAYVGVRNFRSVPLTVTVQEINGPPFHLKLAPNGSSAFSSPGAPLTVTIPANDNVAKFAIEGDVLGFYQLRFTSPGCFEGIGTGKVS